MNKQITVAMSGASGVQYGLKLIETLVELEYKVDLVVSNGARKVMELELSYNPDKILASANNKYDIMDIGAKIASGTHQTQGMIVVPCSTKTLSAIANGFSMNLIHRAAECMLKEGKKLVLMMRETPLSLIHIQNMLTAKQAGAVILPASPGFYYKPQKVGDLVNFVVGKILNVFDIEHDLFQPWDPDKVKK